MKKLLAALLLLALTLSLTTTALADRSYIFPESSTRRLTWAEVDEWDYESLGFAFHEILARHGFVFNPTGRYYAYFNSKPWYTPNADSNNDRACYPRLSGLEWDNIELIKSVRASKEYNDYGRSIWDSWTGGITPLSGFTYMEFRPNQALPVYAAPGTSSYRATNGLAEVSTNGAIYVAGVENGWMLILYETNWGAARVGYIDTRRLSGSVPACRQLNFSRTPARLVTACTITDDPITHGSTITCLPAGTSVTYLTTFYGDQAWDYVEFRVYGQLARGFIPSGLLDMTDDGPTLLY
ncbi:MAG: YARHG domain-containing protein [Clostridia bacterium]|nr:YARHG domain-containing protein [Clostridia bacterium]